METNKSLKIKYKKSFCNKIPIKRAHFPRETHSNSQQQDTLAKLLDFKFKKSFWTSRQKNKKKQKNKENQQQRKL